MGEIRCRIRWPCGYEIDIGAKTNLLESFNPEATKGWPEPGDKCPLHGKKCKAK